MGTGSCEAVSRPSSLLGWAALRCVALAVSAAGAAVAGGGLGSGTPQVSWEKEPLGPSR